MFLNTIFFDIIVCQAVEFSMPIRNNFKRSFSSIKLGDPKEPPFGDPFVVIGTVLIVSESVAKNHIYVVLYWEKF